MEFISIEKLYESRFITRYNVQYMTNLGNIKNYEIVSRNNNLTSLEDLKNILAEIIYDQREKGRCYAMFERQGCFHITVK